MNQAERPMVTEDEVKAFQRDGCVCLRGIFDETWVMRLQEAVERVKKNPGPLSDQYMPHEAGDFFADKFMWTFDPDFRAFVLESPAPGVIGSLMGATKVNIFYDHLLVKEPGTVSATPWHQDNNFWPLKGKQLANIWLPLDRVDLDNGTLEFVRGSHLWTDRPYTRGHAWGDTNNPPYEVDDPDAIEVDDTEPFPDIENNRGNYDIVSWDLEPGDCLAFYAMTLHYSPPNLTQRRRRALATRWTGDDMRWLKTRKMLQLIRDPGLKTGDKLDCELFPVVWQQAG